MIIQGDARSIPLRDESVQCVVTSPPYWGLRDYGTVEQIGLEKTPELYVEKMVAVFREVKRALRDDGTCWINLGDSYAARGNSGGHSGIAKQPSSIREKGWRGPPAGLKDKDLVGIPWMVAFALRADGWYLRSDIIWAKPNPMPESVTDRPTKSHEYIFLLSKRERYYFDQDAVKEVVTGNAHGRGDGVNPKCYNGSDFRNGKKSVVHENVGQQDRRSHFKVKQNPSFSAAVKDLVEVRNIRSVWTLATQPFAEAHFAVFPQELAKRCILAGCPTGGIVLDPFTGSGTTVQVAQDLGRIGIGLDLKPEYLQMARRRSAQQGLRL